MAELKEIAQEKGVDLENCVIFVRGNEDILAVDIPNARIKQRNNDTTEFTFSLDPKQALKLEKYFGKFTTGEKFYFDISQTGYKSVYYRGLFKITKKINKSIKLDQRRVKTRENKNDLIAISYIGDCI